MKKGTSENGKGTLIAKEEGARVKMKWTLTRDGKCIKKNIGKVASVRFEWG